MFMMCCLFFKQKTAYELRISDWSSDVCSSDLCVLNQQPGPLRTGNASLYKEQAALGIRTDDFQILLRALPIPHVTSHLLVLEDATGILAITRRAVGTVRNGYAVGGAQTRSEEGRGGKGWVDKCRSRWSAAH